ncbi:glycosyltransferase [Microbacterium sp. AGC85]
MVESAHPPIVPIVDLTIAVHSATRPIARAVASVVDHTQTDVRVNVVAHNIDPGIIRANLGRYADDSRVRLLTLRDGIGSPAGPMNHGFARSDAPFLSVMGSDDELAPGAIDSWLRLQRATNAEVVLARIATPGGRIDPYPPVRNGRRTRELDGRKDRLAYRSAPVGLIDRARFGQLRFTEGLPSGEDLAYSATLWFTGSRLAYDLHGPGYVLNDDAADRVTTTPRPVAENFAFLNAIEALDWFKTCSPAVREALIVKLIRLHFFDVLRAHARAETGIVPSQADLRGVLERLEAMSPRAVRLLSRADRHVLDILRRGVDATEFSAALDARWHYRTLRALVPRNPLLALHRQAPLRTLGAGLRASAS